MMRIVAIALTATGLVFAQTAPPPNGGWRRATAPAPAPAATAPPTVAAAPAPAATAQDPEPVDHSDAYGQPVQNQAPPDYSEGQAQAPPPRLVRPSYGLPAELTMKSGAYVTVRLNEGLSTDHNQQGDPFSATLEQPIVVDGIVVANRGQTVYGRVAGVEKQKSDRPSRIALQLTSLTLADGTQTPITSQLMGRQGGRTPAGAQVGTVATTTAVGAGIGAVAAWGTGAAIGAGAGAAAGIIGVLLTRNHPTVVYPETALTFQITSPVGISTARAPQAFRYVGPEDYSQPPTMQLSQRPPVQPCYGCAGGYSGYYGSGPGWGSPYPYWGWAPGFSVVIGRGFGPGWGYGGYRGFRGYRRWR